MSLLRFNPRRITDGGGPTNGERAEMADKIIRRYPSGGDEEKSTNLQDMLSDCMHWCHREGVDFDELLRLAENHFIEETGTRKERKQ